MRAVRLLPGLAVGAALAVTVGALLATVEVVGPERMLDLGRLLARGRPLVAVLVVAALATPPAAAVSLWRLRGDRARRGWWRWGFVTAVAGVVVAHTALAARYHDLLPTGSWLVVALEVVLLAAAAAVTAGSPDP